MAVIQTKQFDTRSAKRSNRTSVREKVAENQVQNSDGGFVWQVNDWDRLNRFLILGAEGGTYYVSEQDLLKTGHESVLQCIKLDGVKTVQTIVAVSEAGRAYKNDPAVFALALCATHGDAQTRRAVYTSLNKVCRIGTHLYHFIHYCSAMRGWGSGMRRAVGRWFTSKEADKLAMQMVKYQQRDGWSASDALRLAHPIAKNPAQDAVFRWVVSGLDGLDAREVKRRVSGKNVSKSYPAVREHLPAVIEAFEQAKQADARTLVKLIAEHNLPREAIPTDKLNSMEVWEALLQNMPMTAMIRNLGKMTAVGLLKPLNAATKLVVSRLADTERLRKSRVHPMQVLLASKVYDQGHGDKGSLAWSAIPAISGALDQAFYATFPNVVPCGKPLLIALDVSGSMSSPFGGTSLRSCEATAALSLIHAAVEPECHIFGFAHTFRELGIRKGMTLSEATRKAQDNNFGSTNVALAFEYALKHKIQAGGFIVMTDSEVNCGRHPAQAIREYRERMVQDARCVVVATTATPFTINDPNDRFGMDVVGFDASAPPVIADFIRGDQPVAVVETE
jgi:60 kDa SS-A/Ro ribonucleoprotein